MANESVQAEPALQAEPAPKLMAVGDFIAARNLETWQARVFVARFNLSAGDVKPIADLERDLGVALHGGI